MSKAPHITVPIQATKSIDALAISHICGLADAGEVEQAARAAALHFANGAYAVAPFAVWLGAGFAWGGPAVLPGLLKQAGEQLQADQAARPTALRDWKVSLSWLAENVRSRVRFHAKFHDQVWNRWCSTLTPCLVGELDDACSALVQSANPELRHELADILQSLTIIIRRTFAPLVPVLEPAMLVEEAELEQERLGEQVIAHDVEREEDAAAEDSFDSSHTADVCPQAQRAGGDHATPQQQSSSPMRALQAKLSAFERLAHEQAWPMAAMLARDIERELSQFDPVRYFPQYFLKYLNTLCAVGAELEMHMQPAETLESQALERLYHADPEQFLFKINAAAIKG